MARRRRRRKVRFGRLFMVFLMAMGLCSALYLICMPIYHRYADNLSIQEALFDRTSSAHPRDHSEEVAKIKEMNALDEAKVAGFSDEEVRSLFYSNKLSESQIQQITGSSFYEGQNFITLDDLRCVRVLYIDFKSDSRVGELIVNKEISSDVEKIFYDLYIHQYQIGKIALADTYQGSETENMEANNTYGLLFSQPGKMEQDAFNSGCAITLNPKYNPKVTEVYGKMVVTPASSYAYSNRNVIKKYMIDKDNYAYRLFVKNGFYWGGSDTATQNYGVFWKDFKSDSHQEKEDQDNEHAQSTKSESAPDSAQQNSDPENEENSEADRKDSDKDDEPVKENQPTYDMYGNPIKKDEDKEEDEKEDGSQSEPVYDMYGNLITTTPDASGGSVIIGYDLNGNPLYSAPPASSQNQAQTIIGYDYYGNPIYSQPPANQAGGQADAGQVITGYDSYGNPVYGSSSAAQVITGYDEYGNPVYQSADRSSQEGTSQDGSPAHNPDGTTQEAATSVITGYDLNGNPVYGTTP